MTTPDDPPPQTTTFACVTCGDPVRVPVEWADDGPFKHHECPPPGPGV